MRFRFDSLITDPRSAVFFEQQLRHIRQEVVLDQQVPLSGFKVIPQNTNIASHATQYEHRMYEPLGVARFISDYADDLPLVDIATRSEVFNLRTFGCAYQFSLEEIEASAATPGLELEKKRAMAARLVTEQKFNRIMFWGDPDTRLFGLLNYPYIPRRLLDVKFSYETSDPHDILNELNELVNSIFDLTETTGYPDYMGMPPAAYTHIASRALREGSDTTILQHFMMNNPFFKDGGTVEPLQELKGAGPDGEDLIFVGRRDENLFSHALARPFTQLAPEARNLAIITNCHAKSGGVACDRPLELVIGELKK